MKNKEREKRMKYQWFLLCGVMCGILFIVSPALAVDDVILEDLQTDVSVTKSKANQNAADIQNLKGGLPAEIAAREAADLIIQEILDELLDRIEFLETSAVIARFTDMGMAQLETMILA